MRERELEAVRAFFAQVDEGGVSNGEKARERSRVIRRVATTPKDRSYEPADTGAADTGAAGAAGTGDGGAGAASAGAGTGTADTGAASAGTGTAGAGDGGAFPPGVVEVGGKLVGFGIHILNEDVYPLQSFEIYLRGCDLVGTLDLSGCTDVVFVDLYRNRISAVDVANMPSLRILGLQGNQIVELDPTGLPACQGIDAGMNRLERIDVSRNPELVELYVNDNRIAELDTSSNQKLKYLRCQNNLLTSLDTTANPLLRHLYAESNPLKSIRALAPGGDGQPLELTAGDGGTVGLSFNPIYDAQWKETGEWEQSYHARAHDGFAFAGWFDERGACVSRETDWRGAYGESRRLFARFSAERAV